MSLDTAIDLVVGSLEYVLLAPPALLMVAILGVIAFLLAGWRVALFTVLGLVFIISLDLWEAAMQTLALVLAATAVALVIGIPIGIIAAKSERHRDGRPSHPRHRPDDAGLRVPGPHRRASGYRARTRP